MSLSITKKFRQLWRTDNGAGYQAVTEEGTELLLLGSDGSRLSHVLQGIDLDAALSFAGEPNWKQGAGDNLLEIEQEKAQPAPYVPEPEPEPESEKLTERAERRIARAPEPPTDPLLDASARYIAKREPSGRW